MKRQFIDLTRCCSATVLACALFLCPVLLPAKPAGAATTESSVVMMQCRNLSFDQTGFDQCLEVIERESELSLQGIESDWSAFIEQTETADVAVLQDSQLSDADQWRIMATQYREYRDQVCDFSASGLDAVSVGPAVQACRIAMNRSRVSFLQRQFIERRSRAEHGTFYRGYFLMTDSNALFQSCELRQDWEIDASDEVLATMRERYDEVTTESLELVYIELRGQLSVEENTASSMRIQQLNLMRPVLDTDCTAVIPANIDNANTDEQSIAQPEDDVIDEPGLASITDEPLATGGSTQATIDDYGASGFMYGYFGEWTSVCAADAPQVCQAQASHSLSTEGDWQLLIDRSTSLAWRVRLLPTTNSHIVGDALQLSFDGVALTTIPVVAQQIILDRPQTIVQGDAALQLINRMKTSGTLELSWNSDNQSSSNLIFSLNGVTLALDYFDNR